MSKLAINGGPRMVPEGVAFVAGPAITDDDEKAVLSALRANRLSLGPEIAALEAEFAEWNGNAFCAATNSGTAALHMAIAGCGIGAGDEVITTSVSWTSSATSILHHNAIPVFVDVDWEFMHLDPSKLEAAITPRTRAILAVHYWGMACDMEAILAIARRHGLRVIEDACQSVGAAYHDRKTGTLADCAAFSLNQNKNLSSGEGGLFVTDNEEIYVAARALMNFGELSPPRERDYHSYGMGWMYRTNDLTAALARSRLRKLDRSNELAVANWSRLHDALEGLPHLVRMPDVRHHRTNGYAYVIRTDPDSVRSRSTSDAEWCAALVAALTAEGVPVEAPRWLLPAHTVFQARNGYGHGCPWTCRPAGAHVSYDLAQYPVGRQCADSSIWLDRSVHRTPSGPEQIDVAAGAIRKVFEHLDQVPVPVT